MSALAVALEAGPPRLELAQLPTPLHPAPRLSADLGVEVWFKRDDLTGLGLGGNKLRPLEYLLADAVGQGCDCLVTGAGPQSNWTMLAALTAIRLGLEPHVVCYGDPAPEWGNLLLHRRLGTMLSWTGDPDRPSVDAGMDEVGARLRRAGRRPYVVPRGGATAVGALGYARATVELDRQLEAVGLRPETLWLAAGSGATMAGLILGSARLPASYTVQGVTVSRPDVAMQVDELARGAAALLGDPDRLGGTDLLGGTDTFGGAEDLPPADVLGGWIGAGYGVASAEGDAAATLVARTESLFLDPVFGAKAMAALIDAARAGRVRGPVVYLVSGGAPTLFNPAPAGPQNGKDKPV